MEATSIFGVDILFLLSVASLCVDDLAQCDLAVARRSGLLVDAWIDRSHFSCFLSSGRGPFFKNQVSTKIVLQLDFQIIYNHCTHLALRYGLCFVQ